MKKLLIVDDEVRIGKLIKSVIRWEELGLTCAGVLTDGGTAWEAVQATRPDIVITDVQMPVMNGLELIRMTREAEMPVSFIVLSGYQEFEYAKTAMEYGVEQYLVKPIDENELDRALQKLVQQLNKQEEEQAKQKELIDKAAYSDKIIRQNFLRNIIEQRQDNQYLPFELAGDLYMGMDIKLDYANFYQRDYAQDRITSEQVQNIIEEILEPETEQMLLVEKEYLHLYCLCCISGQKEEGWEESLAGRLLLSIKEYLRGLDQYIVTIGIGNPRKSIGEIRFSILEAYIAVCNRIIYGTGRLIWASTVCLKETPEWEASVQGIRQKILQNADALITDNMDDNIRKLFGSVEDIRKINMSDYYRVAAELTEDFFSVLDMEEEDLLQSKQNLLECVQHSHRIFQLVRLLITGFSGQIQKALEQIESHATRPIRISQQYVEEHYAEKILLEDVADAVGLNPVYFSSLFKKETGQNFSAYLSGVRMEKAKELLTTSNDTIAVIAEAVGYPEQKYFSQQFKKIVGVKPVIYRKLHT